LPGARAREAEARAGVGAEAKASGSGSKASGAAALRSSERWAKVELDGELPRVFPNVDVILDTSHHLGATVAGAGGTAATMASLRGALRTPPRQRSELQLSQIGEWVKALRLEAMVKERASVHALSRALTYHVADPGERIFAQGDAGDAFYALLSGQVGLYVSGPNNMLPPQQVPLIARVLDGDEIDDEAEAEVEAAGSGREDNQQAEAEGGARASAQRRGPKKWALAPAAPVATFPLLSAPGVTLPPPMPHEDDHVVSAHELETAERAMAREAAALLTATHTPRASRLSEVKRIRTLRNSTAMSASARASMTDTGAARSSVAAVRGCTAALLIVSCSCCCCCCSCCGGQPPIGRRGRRGRPMATPFAAISGPPPV
jgi:hypothetical protein